MSFVYSVRDLNFKIGLPKFLERRMQIVSNYLQRVLIESFVFCLYILPVSNVRVGSFKVGL